MFCHFVLKTLEMPTTLSPDFQAVQLKGEQLTKFTLLLAL